MTDFSSFIMALCVLYVCISWHSLFLSNYKICSLISLNIFSFLNIFQLDII